MDSPYDLQAWADATSRGRRLYNYNFRMIGNELRGWDLVNVVPMENATEYYDVVYLWEKKGTSGRELVRIGVVEAADWRLAQYRLRDELLLSMRPDIPHGTGRLAEIGDVNYASQEPGGTLLASIIFSLGNVTVTVRSAGDKPVPGAPCIRGETEGANSSGGAWRL